MNQSDFMTGWQNRRTSSRAPPNGYRGIFYACEIDGMLIW